MYLGMPLTGHALKHFEFVLLLDKMVAKLESWQWKAFSFVGRAVLLQSVLIYISIYMIASLYILPSILHNVEKHFHTFLWGCHSTNQHGLYLLSWSIVCTSKFIGGLTIHSLQ